MSRVQINENYFVKDGRPFFYQGDTLWMAFSKLSLGEWHEVMAKRRLQGFSVAQISVLPISHDNAPDAGDIQPFEVRDGAYDFDRINPAYFDKAEAMLMEAVRQGIVPCLHLLWVNYVPDTWAAQRSPGTVMTWEQMERFLRYAVPRFEKYEPIYSLSGDTRFETDRVVDIYSRELALMRKLAPEALLTMHLTPNADPPKELVLDFYSYQAGHLAQEQDNNFLFAGQFLARGDGKPIVNSEPPYEAHGHGFRYGRFSAFDVRKALWMSLLSGASAGYGYGAHGMWMMFREGQGFNNIEFSGKPFYWRTMLELDGAWEGGFAQHLYRSLGLYGMKPLDCLREMPAQVHAAQARNGTVLIYAPYACDVTTRLEARKYSVEGIELEGRRWFRPVVCAGEGGLKLEMPQFNADVLYVLVPKA